MPVSLSPKAAGLRQNSTVAAKSSNPSVIAAVARIKAAARKTAPGTILDGGADRGGGEGEDFENPSVAAAAIKERKFGLSEQGSIFFPLFVSHTSDELGLATRRLSLNSS